MAWIRVSGTYRPPKGPKSPLSTSRRTHEPPNPLAVLLAGPLFQGARGVHPIGLEVLDRLPHVLGTKPPGDDDVITPPERFRQLPVEPGSRPAPGLRAPRIEQEQVRLVTFDGRERLRVTHPQGLHDPDPAVPYLRQRLRRLVAVELGVVEPDLAGDPQHLPRIRIHEHPDLQHPLGQRGGYLARPLHADPARALGEDEPDRIRPRIRGHAGIVWIGYAANLYLDHGVEILLPRPRNQKSEARRPSLLRPFQGPDLAN